ncbi:hypothetical protein AMTRI_Chr02g216390 [Amborella trichopoda]|uniref:Uncharacterized protein n=1 Tax=Amborella trichopoda TaxID=13333 RepID=W1PWB7_AMBTC|nr:uncharacterized protein LOC18440256 [Amborella trichopoda]ERN12051.1 hypothetical protein AMTR_s00035p00105030 [Amborella trichopoda]|eukprot:XP_006850470.3 uncharacterized protein LOC18440256 [Amborella trichopoda]
MPFDNRSSSGRCGKSLLPFSSLKANLLLFSTSLCLLLIFLFHPWLHCFMNTNHPPPFTSPHHIVFGIASSFKTWPPRSSYVRLWWKNTMRGYAWLDRLPPQSETLTSSPLPQLKLSEDTSAFSYTYKGGLRSAIRVSRIVTESFRLGLDDVRWFVMGDDDTVFCVENLVRVLRKYDHRGLYYVGANSESVEQNDMYAFGMAFGGGGFAISYGLARVLARVMDSCLRRYPHVYGSDARIYACVSELGVGLTAEAGFHQVDIRGNVFGFLSSHPLEPLVSLHHVDTVEPIFPNMTRIQALERLYKAIGFDPSRVLQRTVCYDKSKAWTISVSWGYSVQVFDGIVLFPDLLPLQRTFMPWRRGRTNGSAPYMFNTQEFPRDPCKRPATFFLDKVNTYSDKIISKYSRHMMVNCNFRRNSARNLGQIIVHSEKQDSDLNQMRRRDCCGVLPSSYDNVMEIGIKKCGPEEMISA